MASELQRLVDHLGNRLGRSVAIDDPHVRLLAYNAHAADAAVDDIRGRLHHAQERPDRDDRLPA